MYIMHVYDKSKPIMVVRPGIIIYLVLVASVACILYPTENSMGWEPLMGIVTIYTVYRAGIRVYVYEECIIVKRLLKSISIPLNELTCLYYEDPDYSVIDGCLPSRVKIIRGIEHIVAINEWYRNFYEFVWYVEEKKGKELEFWTDEMLADILSGPIEVKERQEDDGRGKHKKRKK